MVQLFSRLMKIYTMKKIILLLSVAAPLISLAQNNYVLDKNHSKLGFSALHMEISHVEGRFKNFDATLVSSKEDFSDAVIGMTADVKSIDTDVEMRDNDLRSPNWFDADQYPKLIFKSTSFQKTDDKNYKLTGVLTIHGITKPISLDVVYNGKHLNAMSKKNSVGFTITGKLKRSDFELGTKTPNTVVEDVIDLIANAEFIVN
jgi:polyisoprenoid-binding protein YceI